MTDERQNPLIAHVREDENGQFVVHDLEDHLRGVAQLAEEFARDFGSADWAYIAGVWRHHSLSH